MCGILGWLGRCGPEAEQHFEIALDLLAHRGPDDRGVWAAPGVLLGHRRLSILDLSPAGHQPMVDPVSGAVLVFNGEIYNHLELRKELESCGNRFIGHSDTEVLLHALVRWGASVLTRLNGMWSLAFWHPTKRRLILARDRFGVKPLYYRQGAQGLAFASEPKALLNLFPEHREVAEDALLDFLCHNLLYARGQSFYRGIYVMPPAHYAIYEPSAPALRLSRYWDYSNGGAELLDADEAATQFDTLFTDAVSLRLRSDVPVGLTLSGGLDSTGVLAAAKLNTATALTCFTSVYGKDDPGERSWAELASAAAGARLIPVAAPQDDWLQTMRKVAWHMDGPGYSPAVYPLWYLMRYARTEGVPVLLEGQGADEALAGYPQYAVLDLLKHITDKKERLGLAELFSKINALFRTFSCRWALAWVAREVSPQLQRWHRRRVGFESLMHEGRSVPPPPAGAAPESDIVRQRLLEDHSSSILPGLLHYGDAVSMAHAVESRLPFMDYRLVEWMFNLPSRLRFHCGQTKWVLREYLRIHNQSAISRRPDKKGYPTPVGKWLASESGQEVERMLLHPDNPLHAWCDPHKIKRLIQKNRQGTLAAEHHLYKLFSTRLWLKECLGE